LLGLDHLAGGASDHLLVEWLRGRVRLRVAHPPGHVRVERQVMIAHQYLARPDLGHPRLDQPEVGGHDLTLRAAGQQDLPILLANDAVYLCRTYLKVPEARATV